MRILKSFTAPENSNLQTYGASQSNQITREYYNHLVGEINRGVVQKVVLRSSNMTFGTTSYYLISQA